MGATTDSPTFRDTAVGGTGGVPTAEDAVRVPLRRNHGGAAEEAGAAVQFGHVSKRFRLGKSHDSLRDLLSAGFSRLAGRAGRRRSNAFWALRDVDFAVGRGEAIGIIGPNGAGKSTVLKLLAGILRADRGSVRVRGRLAALIEVGAGFHGDLTGRENIFLNGTILGMTRAEIRAKLDAIVTFAGLEAFMETPVKRYSSGMYARLGFSIASHVEPDVLLVDEVLSVGDAVFRLRCLDRMRQLVATGTTLVFVTHDLDQMQSICDRAIVLNQGGVSFDGPSRDAVSEYMQAMSNMYASRPADLVADANVGVRVRAVDVTFHSPSRGPSTWFRPDESVRCDVAFELSAPVQRLVVELNMRAAVHQNLLSINSGRDGRVFNLPVGTHRIHLALPSIPVSGGPYVWNIRLWDAESGKVLVDTPFRFPFMINDGGIATGALSLRHDWSVDTDHPVPSTRMDDREPASLGEST